MGFKVFDRAEAKEMEMERKAYNRGVRAAARVARKTTMPYSSPSGQAIRAQAEILKLVKPVPKR
jgi:hypothetical protein